MVARVYIKDVASHLEGEFESQLNAGVSFDELFVTFQGKLFWTCPGGHLVHQTPRARLRSKCKECALSRSRRTLKDFHPTLLAEFDNDLNGDQAPENLYSRSPGEYWWRCAESGFHHSYPATVRAKISGRRCVYCAGVKILPGFNDWQTLFGDKLDLLWIGAKNLDDEGNPLDPQTLGVDDRKPRYWKCLTGNHERVISISSAIQGFRLRKACRACAGYRAIDGETDALTVYPELTERLDISINPVSSLSGLHPGSEKSLHWRCENNHNWTRSVKEEIRSKGCTKCSGKVVWLGRNDLRSQHPIVASQFAIDLNLSAEGKSLAPEEVHMGSNANYWWRCLEFGHMWRTTVQKRTLEKTGCPYCSDRKVWPGFNDLVSRRPDLIDEIDFDREPGLNPRKLLWVSHSQVSWKCQEGHEWKAQVYARTTNGGRRPTGCPDCAEFGFNPNRPAILYFIKHEPLGAFKVGIANETSVRLSSLTGKGWVVISTDLFQFGHQARFVEKSFHTWRKLVAKAPNFLNEKHMGRLGGWTETFESARLDESTVASKLQSIIDTIL